MDRNLISHRIGNILDDISRLSNALYAMDTTDTPVLFAYSCDLPRIVRFNTSLELTGRTGTLICFDFQLDTLRRFCGDRVRFQTIDFEKFEGRFFP